MRTWFALGMVILSFFPRSSSAQSQSCSEMETYDPSMSMCMPRAMDAMPMSMLMLSGNGFLVGSAETGNRARNTFYSPNMFMVDIGTSLGNSNYLNLDYMGTLERWTVPDAGYPELLQIGEENNQGVSYIDAQHPHSSPIMGLTLSDTINLGGGKNNLKIFAAPRGEATDGPVAFMHRPTGMVNPVAPLGHHVGQDVGHISSSILGESLKLYSTHLEFSTYHGTEPKPQNVDLPLGSLNSYSFRLIEEIDPNFLAMVSYAYVSNPEPDSTGPPFVNRYSASIYNTFPLSNRWAFNNSLIGGIIAGYDQAATLTSFTEEFLFKGDHPRVWGRVETLQRTPNELQLLTGTDGNAGQWVTALTVGYSHKIAMWESAELDLGASFTADLLPQDYQSAYGGNPFSALAFLQLEGMKMLSLK